MSKFSDPSDHASELEQRERDILLAQHKERAKHALQPTGYCYNCEEPVEKGLFCNSDCRDDFEFRQKMEKHR